MADLSSVRTCTTYFLKTKDIRSFVVIQKIFKSIARIYFTLLKRLLTSVLSRNLISHIDSRVSINTVNEAICIAIKISF